MAGDAQIPFRTRSPNNRDSDEIVVSRSTRKVIVLIVIALLLTVEGAIVALRPQPTWPGAARVDGLLVAFVAGAIILAGIRALFFSLPILIVNRSGIYVRSKLFRGDIITWQEISALIAYRSGLQTCLRIVFTDPQSVISHQTAIQRVTYRILKGNPVTTSSLVTADGTWSLTVNELLGQIHEHFHSELEHNRIQIQLQMIHGT